MTNADRPSPVHITSIDDPRVALFRNVRDRDLRGQPNLFMAESESVVRRLLGRPGALRALLMTPVRYAALRDTLDEHGFRGDAYVADLDLMSAISGFHIHRGVLGLGDRICVGGISIHAMIERLKSVQWPVLLAAEHITNVDNIGSLFRLAAGFGVAGILLSPDCCDPLYRKAIRVSMGHVLRVPFVESRDWTDDLNNLRETLKTKLIAIESGRDGIPAWEMALATVPMILIVGSEAAGMTNATLRLADAVVEIPMQRNTPSLNVATAAGAVLYEVLRQRNIAR